MTGVRGRVGVSLAVALLAAACGGGGGGGGGGGLTATPSAVAFRVLSADLVGVTTTVRIDGASGAQVLAGVPAGQSLPGWLQMPSFTRSGTTATLTLRVPPATRAPTLGGRSVQTVRVVSGDASGNVLGLVDIPVTLEVIAAPTLSTTSVPLAWVESEGFAPTQLTVTRDPAVSLVGASSTVGWLTVTRSGDTLTLAPTAGTSALAAGPHAGSVTVDFSFGGHLSSLVVAVNATVAPALSALAPIAFEVNASTPDATEVVAHGTVVTATQAALTVDPQIDVTWLSAAGPFVTGTSGNVAVAAPKARLAELPNGVYHAALTLVPRGSAVTPLSVPVTLTVRLPEVHAVGPVAFVDTAGRDYVIVRGAGFDDPAAALLLDASPAASVTFVSDTELHVVPGDRSAGDYALAVGNQLGLPRDGGTLHVVPSPSYATTTLDAAIGLQDKILPSARNGLVFTSMCYFCGQGTGTPGTVQRFAYGAGTWTRTEHAFAQLYDIALTLDESTLVVLTSTKLLLVDPGTMATLRTVDLPAAFSGVAYQLAVTSDAEVLIQDIDRAYSLRDGTFRSVPGLGRFDALGLAQAADGSRAFFGRATNDGTQPYRYYDASTHQIVMSSTNRYYGLGKLSRHAERGFSSAYLVGRDLALLATLPVSTSSGGDLSPDGERVYGIEAGTGRLRRFDVSNPLSPVELSTIILPSGTNGRVAVDPTGTWLYAVGTTRFAAIDLR